MEPVIILMKSSPTKRKKERHKTRKKKPTILSKSIVYSVVLAFIIFGGVQWTIYRHLEGVPSTSQKLGPAASAASPLNQKMLPTAATPNVNHGDYRFIIFHKIHEAQGAGNHMHGLLAAHLFGDEFQRTICVSDHYKEFHLAFDPVDPVAIEHCPDILKRHNKEPPHTPEEHTIELLNYRAYSPNECALKKLLSSKTRVLHLISNTYPRWPRVPNQVNFFAFYKAKPILLDLLAYPHSQPPPIVVHLRLGDTTGKDNRKGVDDESLRSLGKLLPVDGSRHSPFLVTNAVEWYSLFEKQYGWSHSQWQMVKHSALGIQWEGRLTDPPKLFGGNSDISLLQKKYASLQNELGTETWETLQLWADWYTLLRAEKIYHTFSDFSLSAVHWMGTWSRTYDGVDQETGKLILLEENWVVDGESPRLVDRTRGQLKHCNDNRRGRGF